MMPIVCVQAKRDLGIRVQEYAPPPPRPLIQKSRTLTNFYEKVSKERKDKLIQKPIETQACAPSEPFWAKRLKGPMLQRPRILKGKRVTPFSGQHVSQNIYLTC